MTKVGQDGTNLLLIDDTRGANAFDVSAEREQRLDFLFCDIVWHDDRFDTLSTHRAKPTYGIDSLASYPLPWGQLNI